MLWLAYQGLAGTAALFCLAASRAVAEHQGGCCYVAVMLPLFLRLLYQLAKCCCVCVSGLLPLFWMATLAGCDCALASAGVVYAEPNCVNRLTHGLFTGAVLCSCTVGSWAGIASLAERLDGCCHAVTEICKGKWKGLSYWLAGSSVARAMCTEECCWLALTH